MSWMTGDAYDVLGHYDNDVIAGQRDVVNRVRFFGGRDDYALDYALLTFMETGIIPDKTDAGWNIDKKLARRYIRSYNKSSETLNMNYRRLV
jgi:hypothetical protein